MLESRTLRRIGVSFYVVYEHAITAHSPNECSISCLSFIEHKHSDYCFTWHYNYGNQKFDSGKLYKVARSIIASNKPGSIRLSHIMKLLGKNLAVNYDKIAGKYPQDVDMVNQVAAVKAAVAAKLHFGFLIIHR